MTNPFYARFIPPSTQRVPDQKSEDLTNRPAKKRKLDITHEDIQAIEYNRSEEVGQTGSNEYDQDHSLASSKVEKGAKERSKPKRKAHQKSQKSQRNQEESFSQVDPGPFEQIGPHVEGKPYQLQLQDQQSEKSRLDQDRPVSHVRESAKEGKKKKTKPREVKAEAGTVEHELNGHDDMVIDNADVALRSKDRKHDRVLSKYDKSTKVSTVLAANEKAQDAGTDSGQIEPEKHGLVPIPQPPPAAESLPISMSSALPEWLIKPLTVLPEASELFEQFSLPQDLLKALKDKGFQEALPIQSAVLPLLLPGENRHPGDLCISASTGSGKTLAYLVPLVQALRDKPVTHLRGLIVVPTRELVTQAREMLGVISSGTDLKVGTAFGSKSLKEEQENLVAKELRYNQEAYRKQQEKSIDEDEELLNWDLEDLDLEEDADDHLEGYVDEYVSRIDILICTPGRLVEHLQSTTGFTLEHVQWLVIDEADRLLHDSFQQWIDIVMPALEYQPPLEPWEQDVLDSYHWLRHREVQKVILSATLTRDYSKIQELRLRKPRLVKLLSEETANVNGGESLPSLPKVDEGGKFQLPSSLREFAVQVKDEENKPLYLVELLKQDIRRARSQSAQKPRNSGKNRLRPADTDSSNSNEDDDSINHSDRHSGSDSASDSSVIASSPMLSERSPSIDSNQPYGTLIFTSSTDSAHRLSRLLSLLLPSSAEHTATLTKSSKLSSKKALARFKPKSLHTLIATDRASRGLDIQNLAHVINYDMPSSVKSYIHRVGRTARAGKEGRATTLVGWKEGRWFWNEIGRGEELGRKGKVERISVRETEWDEEEKQAYEEALRTLGNEAIG